MYYRGPGFRAVVILPLPSPALSPASKLSIFFSLPMFQFSPVELTDGREGGEGEGAKSYDGEKACSFIIHKLLSELEP